MGKLTEQKPRYKLEHLVVLKYASNTCYTEVVDVSGFEDEWFHLDVNEGLWGYKFGGFFHQESQERKIGESRYIGRAKYGIIGVYDRTNTEHLSSMVHSANEAVESPSSWVDDD